MYTSTLKCFSSSQTIRSLTTTTDKDNDKTVTTKITTKRQKNIKNKIKGQRSPEEKIFRAFSCFKENQKSIKGEKNEKVVNCYVSLFNFRMHI